MLQKSRFFIAIIILALILDGCAKRGRPSGGPKDEDAPILVTADPPYETTNFDKKKIEIEFNEYITLKELTKQLVVSPPLKNNPIITPQGTPSKYLTIELMDTLLENTTYTFDFGRSVQDNNEGNVIEKFKYVFSTGDYIDSLRLNGTVEDAFDFEMEKNIKLLLFKADSTYSDSLVYKVKPNYVTSALDTTIFEFTNLAPGNYHLVALQDENGDYFFQPENEKIGYLDSIISLPEDSIISAPTRLFKEKLPYEFKRATEASKGRILIGYKGNVESLEVSPLSDIPKDYRSVWKFEKGKDTLNYWFHNFDKDSIQLLVKANEVIDTAIVRFRKNERDSLLFSQLTKGYIEFNDTLFFSSNNPIIQLDTAKIKLFDKDTLPVAFQGLLSPKENKVGILFDKQFEQTYRLEMLPHAVSDVFGFINDTIKSQIRTRKLEDYGDITVDVQNNENKNLIVQLITEKDQLISEKFIDKSQKVIFNYLRPSLLKIRIIHDKNNNQRWDTGSFLAKRQPEKVFYFSKVFEVRSNWSLNETISLPKNF